jgi:hypothetical protein
LLISEWDEHLCSIQELAERFVNEWKIMGMRKVTHIPVDGLFNPEDCLEMFENHLKLGHMNVHARNLFLIYGKNNLVKPKTFMQNAYNLLEKKLSFMNCGACNNLSTIVNKTEEIDFS